MYPGWSTFVYWIVGIVAALLLFISVLVHELSHSFVAKGRGLPVQGITLFIFGGVSNLRGEARRAWDEFAIAIVGPLTSAVLAGAFWGLTFLVTDPSSPLAAFLSYLAIINGLVAAFNLLPGFPLDGGRVLRSILWGGTGSLVKATNIAAMVGRILGWALIGWGVFRILQGDLLGGLWTAFIGWFLSSIADASRKEVVAQEIFQGVRVGDVMDPEPEAVSPGMTADEIVTECFLRRGRRAVPVCDESGLIGIVSLSDIKEIPQERWGSTTAGEVMTREPLHRVSPANDLTQAMNLMNEHDINQVLVTEDGQLKGMLNRAHIMRYLRRIEELGIEPVTKSEEQQREARLAK